VWTGRISGVFSPGPLYELHRSESHKQADILDTELSEISCGSQKGFVSRGSSIDPSNIADEKHSRIKEVVLLDLCQEYHKQASPG